MDQTAQGCTGFTGHAVTFSRTGGLVTVLTGVAPGEAL